MEQLKLTTIADLNALGTNSVLLVALEINIPSTPTIYVVNNSENINFQGNEYIAFPFEIGEISAGKGETPNFQILLDNTSRAMSQYVMAYDAYLKQNGIDGNGITCTAYVLNTNDLSEAVLTEYFQLTNFNTDNKTATFNLGTESLFNKTYPPRKMYANFCSFKFKDARCGYTGELLTCNKTLSDCRARKNSKRFGGFMGLGGGYRE